MIEKILERLEAEKEIAEKEMEKCIFKGLPYHDSTEGKVIGIKKAYEIVQEVAKEYVTDTNVGEWIPCSERLPEVYEDSKTSDTVLICGYDKDNDYSWQAMGFYAKTESIKRWFFAECKNTDKPIDWIDIVAWQPLPAPYQKGELHE